jgi:hypothetical protein
MEAGRSPERSKKPQGSGIALEERLSLYRVWKADHSVKRPSAFHYPRLESHRIGALLIEFRSSCWHGAAVLDKKAVPVGQLHLLWKRTH